MGSVDPKAVKLPPFTPRRRYPPHERKAIARHARQVGELIYAWNTAHGALAWVLWSLLPNREDLFELLDSTKGERDQRDRVYVAAKAAGHIPKSLRKEIIWVVDKLEKLSQIRNDAAHVQMNMMDGELVPNEVTTKAKKQRHMLQNPIEKTWRAAKGDLIALADYASDLHISMMGNGQKKLAFRPKLKSQPFKGQQKL